MENTYDIPNENNDIPISSADMEDAATERGKQEFLDEWNKLDETGDSFNDVIGESLDDNTRYSSQDQQ